MAIPTSGPIKMGGTGTNSIAQVKAGTDTGTPSGVQNVSLKGLSVDGVTDFQYTGGANTDITGTPDGNAPYAMSEFRGYAQGPSTQTITYTQNGPTGKIGQSYSSSHSTTTMAFGGSNLTQFVTNGSGYFRITWSTSLNTNWTSVTIGSATLNRANADTISGYTHGFYGGPSSVGTSATFTYG